MNGDGLISKEELAFFNKNADIIDRKQDGVIMNIAESVMFKSVTDMNGDNQKVQEVVNKYLTGQTLTADEEKILEESTVTIRKNMNKAAGFNTEG